MFCLGSFSLAKGSQETGEELNDSRLIRLFTHYAKGAGGGKRGALWGEKRRLRRHEDKITLPLLRKEWKEGRVRLALVSGREGDKNLGPLPTKSSRYNRYKGEITKGGSFASLRQQQTCCGVFRLVPNVLTHGKAVCVRCASA